MSERERQKETKRERDRQADRRSGFPVFGPIQARLRVWTVSNSIFYFIFIYSVYSYTLPYMESCTKVRDYGAGESHVSSNPTQQTVLK